MKHRWKDKARLYEVTYTGMVEVAFDKKPTDQELAEALADNLAYRIGDAIELGYLCSGEDLTWELIEVRPLE